MKEYTASLSVKAIEADGIITIVTTEEGQYILAIDRNNKDYVISRINGWIRRYENYLEAYKNGGIYQGVHAEFYFKHKQMPDGTFLVNVYAEGDITHSSVSGMYSMPQDCYQLIADKIRLYYEARILIDLIFGKGMDIYGRTNLLYKEEEL